MIFITARRDGFRRCGRAHPAIRTAHEDDAFDADQLARLKADPMLVVEISDAEPQAPRTPTMDEVVEAIREMTAAEMTDKGAPKVDALNHRLGVKGLTAIAAATRNEAVKLAAEAGWKAPGTEA